MKKKRIFSTAISIILFCISMIQTPLQVSAEDKISGFFKYKEEFNGISITGCTEEIEALVIPEEIDGKPVTIIESQAFANHTEMKSAVLPDSLKELGDRAFTNCTALESINLPAGLTAIKHNTFNRCSSLEQIVIPDSVRSIGTGAFRNCTKLAEITFPKQLDMINSSAFTDTAWLDNQQDGYICISNVLYWYKGIMPENTGLTLDESITVISDKALSAQNNLTNITFHDHVTAIGWGAFQETGIVSAVIPPITQIGSSTFSGCKKLKSAVIPGTVKTIDSQAFSGCVNLETVELQNGIQTIGTCAFLDCHSLNSISIPSSVKYIYGCAFGYRTPDNPEGDDILLLKESDDFTVFGYPYTAAETYAAENGFRFAEPADAPAAVPGDVNCDGSVRISDIVLFAKWLVTEPDAILKKIETADMNEDGKLNSADLSLMKLKLMSQTAQELKININWDNKNKQKDEICRFLQDSIARQIPDFDFSKFTFDWTESFHDKQPPISPLGDTICFRLSYQDIQLDYDKYAVKVNLLDNGRYGLDADFLTIDFTEKLAAIDTTGIITKDKAIETAKSYASEMKLGTETGKYQPSEQFGEDTVLLYYSVADACLAYKVHDPIPNRYYIRDGVGGTMYSVCANVFVDAKAGKVLENRYDKMVAIT